MNFRKFRKNAKALSPVVASIILIAVTVAVSIAVAAWMGGMSIGFMQTEQVTITNVQFSGTNIITVTLSNTGTTNVTISSATVNGDSATLGGTTLLGKNTSGNSLTLTMTGTWAYGNSYQIRLVSAKGNSFTYNAVA